LHGISSAGTDGVMLLPQGTMVAERYDKPKAEIPVKTRQTVGDRLRTVVVHGLYQTKCNNQRLWRTVRT